MKNIIMLLVACCIFKLIAAQTRQSVPAIPDINKLMKMSPAEIEAYKKQVLNETSRLVKQKAAQNSNKIDEAVLPDFELKLPEKDSKRLAMLPSQPPTMNQLIDELVKTKQQIESVAPKEMLDEVNAITLNQTPAQMQSSSVATFYADKPVQALLISMQSILKNNNEVIAWNNLSAIYNMAGMQHKAVSILMHHLRNLPNNSMLLNNMGQAYLGLGDVPKAKTYLLQCLMQDPLNPEANRSMGMVCLIEKNYDKSKEYFEKEIEVTQRESTISLLEQNKLAISVYLIRDKTTAIPDRNFFDEIQLGKFKVPDFPQTSDLSKKMGAKHGEFRESLLKEILFWGEKAKATPEQLAIEGKRLTGLYEKQVKRLLKDLHKKYTPYDLSLFNDIHVNQLKQIFTDYSQKMNAVKCPLPPPGVGNREIDLAYDKKCCDLKKPIIDAFMAQNNAFVKVRIDVVSGIYKQYINKLINIVSLDPSPANKRFACGPVVQYFEFLYTASVAGQFMDPPSECHFNMTSEDADSLIQSSRNIDLQCPNQLNVEIDLQVAKLKADCSKFSISGGQGLRLGFERSFKTGTSTLSGGVGMKANFLKAGGADISQMLYVSWDNNNSFSDFGLRMNGSIKVGGTPVSIAEGIAAVGGTIAGIDGGYSLGINSGFTVSVKGKGLLSGIINYEY
jgi:tetratricopeptide (TPR) repeat protein